MRWTRRDAVSPQRPARPCVVPGCPGLAVRGGRCALHARQQQAQHDAQRPTAAERGYDAEWRTARRAYIAAQPYCEWPGCGQLAVDVHHVYGIAAGHDAANLMSVCRLHHNRLTHGKRAAAGG